MRLRALGVLVLAASALARPVAAQVSDPPVVIDAYDRARGGQDVDAALGLFGDDAMVTVQERATKAFIGKAQIRDFLSVFVVQSRPRLTSSRHVVGNTVTWTERDDQSDLSVEAVVRDGKIRLLAYRPAPLGSASDAGSAVVPAPMLVAAATASLLLTAVGLRMLVAKSARSRRTTSSLRGHLLADLDAWRLARKS